MDSLHSVNFPKKMLTEGCTFHADKRVSVQRTYNVV